MCSLLLHQAHHAPQMVGFSLLSYDSTAAVSLQDWRAQIPSLDLDYTVTSPTWDTAESQVRKYKHQGLQTTKIMVLKLKHSTYGISLQLLIQNVLILFYTPQK